MGKLGSILACALAFSLAGCETIEYMRKEHAANSPVTVRQFTASHDAVMKELADLKASSQQSQEGAKRTLAIVDELARRHGSGEITIFFAANGSTLGHDEKDRLVRFADFLSREARSRKILLVSVGSASAYGDQKVNERLAEKRATAPVEFLDKYLVNIPHEYFKVYGTGDQYSPKDVKTKEHGRYQSARIVAVFDDAQLPGNLNAQTK